MTTSSKTNKEQIRFYLDNLVLEIGKQVTRDYQNKNGIWEGMSVSNVKTVSLYTDKLVEIFTQAKEAGKEEGILEGQKKEKEVWLKLMKKTYRGSVPNKELKSK